MSDRDTDVDGNIDELDLESFRAAADDDHGMSLEELSQAFAGVLEQGEDPYAEASEPGASTAGRPAEEPEDEDGDADEEEDDASADDPSACEISPRSIFEAMLFVGHGENEPLTSETVASFMRGVTPREVDQFVVELNEIYDTDGCPFVIESAGAGYRMVLREEFAGLRDKFYGRVKAAKLSQAAIDVLAIVAYKQPMTKEEVDELRGKSSGAVLSQLVRRGLLRVERPETKPRRPLYSTNERFLDVFGLQSLRDLPKSPD